MIISKRADKIDLEDRLVRPDQTITDGVALIRVNGNTIEIQWWQSAITPTTGLIVVEEFPGHWQKLVALRVNRYDRLQVYKP